MSTDDDTGDDGGYVCGSTDTADGDPCQFPVEGPDQTCFMHPQDGSGPPEGHGSGTTSHDLGGDPDADVNDRLPDNAKPNLSHGIHAVQDDPTGTMDWLEDNDPRGYGWVRSKWKSYLVDAPFPSDSAKADDVLHACLMLYAVRSARHEQITRGLVETRPLTDENGDPVIDPETGKPYEVDQEKAVNLPTNRIAREARSILKTAGVTDDPQSKQAQAMGWTQAAREVAEEVPSTDVTGQDDVVDVPPGEGDGP